MPSELLLNPYALGDRPNVLPENGLTPDWLSAATPFARENPIIGLRVSLLAGQNQYLPTLGRRFRCAADP